MEEIGPSIRKAEPGSPLGVLAAQKFSRIAEAERDDGNALRILRDGGENYPAWLDAIAKARRTVHLENYILEEDDTGRVFADALCAAAGRGARVRVLYDWLGCRKRTSAGFWTRLRQAGIEVRCYSPPRLANPLGWISRDHRKVLCVDAELGFTGGLCIGHDWAGDPARGVAPWRDTAVELRGPAVARLEAAFADSWASVGPPIPANPLPDLEPVAAAGSLGVSVIAGRPETMGLYRLELLVAEICERSLWLADAYFVATTGYVHALCGAARAGVDVRLLVPGTSNFILVRTLSRSSYRPLLEAGVRVFEWNGPMMHAKTSVADGCWSRIGSSNSNLASWISNRELDIAVEDEGFARQMEAMFEHDLENATEIVLAAGRIRPSPHGAGGGADEGGPRRSTSGRMVAGAVGFGSAVGASLSQHRAFGAAEAKVMAFGGVLLLGLAVVAAIVPALIAYPLAIVGAWMGASLVARAVKLRAARSRPIARQE